MKGRNYMINRGIFEETLDYLREQLKKSKEELKNCPEGRLYREKRGNETLYLHCFEDRNTGIRTRKSINSNPELIIQLLRKIYLEKEAEILEKDISVTEKCMKLIDKRYIEPTIKEIRANLPEKYRDVPIESFLGEKTDTGRDGEGKVSREEGRMPGMQGVPSISDAPSAWYNGVNESRYGRGTLEWANAAYEKSSYKSESRVHRTSKGLSVRSKSEVLIAEKLYEYGIPLRYEEVLHFGGRGSMMIPDFVLPNAAGGLYYWEHCGLAGNAEYMKRHRQKIENYEKIGIVPWKNLIVTYDDEYGNINTAIIDSEIRNKLL